MKLEKMNPSSGRPIDKPQWVKKEKIEVEEPEIKMTYFAQCDQPRCKKIVYGYSQKHADFQLARHKLKADNIRVKLAEAKARKARELGIKELEDSISQY